VRYAEQFGVGAALLKMKLLHRRLPLVVQFAVTNRCNQRCGYCNIPNLGEKELSLEEITGLTGQPRRLGTRRVVLLGGEPLVRPDIGEIIRLMKRQGMFVGMVTNGWLVPSRLEEIRLAPAVLSGGRVVRRQNWRAGADGQRVRRPREDPA